MKHKLSPFDLQILNQGLQCLDLHVSLQEDMIHSVAIDCEYINNPDGTLRWIWPAKKTSASVLNFYHVGNIQALVKYIIIKLCFALHLTRLVRSGAVTLYISPASVHKLSPCTEWAIFTGTVGTNRKLVIRFVNRKAAYYAKLPLNEKSAANLCNEYEAITSVKENEIIIPNAKLYNGALILSDVKGTHVRRVKNIDDVPVAALCQPLCSQVVQTMLCVADWWKTIKERANELQHIDAQVLLHKRLLNLIAAISDRTMVATSRSHGDFTPWNMYIHNEKPVLIDWELSAPAKPLLYDMFHFIYQDTVLVKHGRFADIRQKIDEILRKADMQNFIETYKIDVALAEQLYLLDNITYYLNVYAEQEHLHVQAGWLMDVWCEALGYWLEYTGQISVRASVLQDVAQHLSGVQYGIFKWQGGDITNLPEGSDIDICIAHKDANALAKWLKNHGNVIRLSVEKRTFMNRMTVLLTDNSFLHIDCIWELKRKALVFGDADKIMQRAINDGKGIKVVRPEDNLHYVSLFYLLNGESVPAKYILAYGQNPVINETVDGLNTAIKYHELFRYESITSQLLVNSLKNISKNKGWKRVFNVLKYLFDTLMSLIPLRGFVFTFSGVDGAGKSTVIENIGKQVEKHLRMPVVVLRHRPSVLPIISAWKYGKHGAEIRSMASLPGTGNNKSRLSSYIRFAYYYTDYVFGQFYVYLRYVLRGYVVLYDRYYFDFINDSRRSNIAIPEKLARSLYALLIKPDVNYFLYAPAGVILQRKKELSMERINILTDKYISLFKKLNEQGVPGKYISICNLELDDTLHFIFSTIKHKRICAELS